MNKTRSNMDPTILSHSSLPQANSWDPKYPFDLMVVYEDTTTRNRAVSLYDFLAQELLDDFDFRCGWWKLSQFHNPNALRRAADVASEANMVVLCIRETEELSPATLKWLKTWLGSKGEQKSALVTLIANSGEESEIRGKLQGFLQTLAKSAGVDFFVQRFDAPDSEGHLLNAHLSDRASLVTPLMEEILDQKFSFPRWGINE